MTIFEIIGFVVVLLAMVLPLLRRAMERRAERKNPQEYARRRKEQEAKEKAALRQLLMQLGEEIPPELREEEEEQAPPPLPAAPPKATPRPVYVERKFASSFEEERDLSDIDERHLNLSIRQDAGAHLLGARFQGSVDASYRFYKRQPSRIGKLVNQPGSTRAMVLLREVLDKPLSLRS